MLFVAGIELFVQSVGGARIELFTQSVGALAYYIIIIQCTIVSDGGIIPPYTTTGIILYLYIQTNTHNEIIAINKITINND